MDPKLTLSSVADEAAENVFSERGLQTMSLELRRQEGLGIRISQWAEYDGRVIMIVFAAALEDSNFHSEAEQVLKWLGKKGVS